MKTGRRQSYQFDNLCQIDLDCHPYSKKLSISPFLENPIDLIYHGKDNMNINWKEGADGHPLVKIAQFGELLNDISATDDTWPGKYSQRKN